MRSYLYGTAKRSRKSLKADYLIHQSSLTKKDSEFEAEHDRFQIPQAKGKFYELIHYPLRTRKEHNLRRIGILLCRFSASAM